jgi:hypothetical protein
VSQGFLGRQCMHTLSFVLLSLPDVVSGSSPPSPLHSDPQSFNPWGRLGCIEPSAHLEGCVKLSLLGSASARAAKLAKSAEERKGPLWTVRPGLTRLLLYMPCVVPSNSSNNCECCAAALPTSSVPKRRRVQAALQILRSQAVPDHHACSRGSKDNQHA